MARVGFHWIENLEEGLQRRAKYFREVEQLEIGHPNLLCLDFRDEATGTVPSSQLQAFGKECLCPVALKPQFADLRPDGVSWEIL